MGSFAGHAWPGFIFVLLGLWWMCNMFHRYFRCLRGNKLFTATVSYNCLLCKRIPLEPVAKILFIIFGIIGEIITGHFNGEFLPKNWQHATMFVFFGMSGVVDLLVHLKFKLPKYTDYAIFLLAIAVEGLLFSFHLHGRNPLDVRLHKLLVISLLGCFVATFAEVILSNTILASLSRAFFFFVQGTWFFQSGFILYSPINGTFQWDPEDEDNLMMVVVYYTWHCGTAFLVVCGIGTLIASSMGTSIAYRKLDKQCILDDNENLKGEENCIKLNLLDDRSENEL